MVFYNENSIQRCLYLFTETTENIKIMKKTNLIFGVPSIPHNFARYWRLAPAHS